MFLKTAGINLEELLERIGEQKKTHHRGGKNRQKTIKSSEIKEKNSYCNQVTISSFFKDT